MDGEDKTKAAKKFQKSYFEVLGLCCSSEVPLVENILKSLDGVKEYSVLVPTKTVIVVHDNLLISQLQIVKALNQARLEANIRVKGETSFQKKWPSPLVVASGVFLVLSLLKFFYHPLHWLALGAVAFGIFPIFLKAIASIRNLSLTNPRLDISILVLIAVVGTIAMLDFVEAGSIVFLFTVAQWLESRAGHKANTAMSSLMSLTPQKAVIVETGEEVDADEVKLNTVLAVKAGEIIPIDGIVVDGNCEVDEKTLTGESYPVLKQKNSTVWAGTINLNGYISVKTTVLAEDCVVAKMAKIVEEAQSSKSKAQRFIDKCALYYTPAIIIISAALAIVPLALRVKNLKHWFHLALVFLVSGCPCALILSTPVVTFCVLTKAATMGVLIKGGDFLETLAKVRVMAFDKTGTITRGEFVVSDFHSLSQDLSLHTLLYWVSSIESKSSHPMATAFVDYAKSFSIETNPDKVVEFQNFPGEGICGIMDGKQISIGNQKMGIRAGCQTGVSMLELDARKGKSVGYVYYRGTAVGIFSLSDACRTGAEEAIEELKSLRIKTAMLTGDTQAAAMHTQQQLGNALELVHAQLLPEDKASIIKEFKNEGITAMIGDGVNDAPALAAADIGISMGISGSALATETGQVILMSNDIKKVPRTIKLARKARRKVIENVIISISTKSGILALAFAGHPLIWAAILVDVGTCLLVIFNSMLLLRGNHNHGGKCFKSSSASKKINHNHSHCCSNPKEEKSCGSTQASQNCASTCESTAEHQTVISSNKCSDLSEKHRGVKQRGGHCCNSFDFKANSNHSTQDHKEGAKKMKTNGHCHSKHSDKDHTKIHIKDDSLEKIVDHQLQLHPVINNCCNGHNSKSTCFSAIDNIHEDVNYSETRTTTMEACVSLEKREIGGCCKSYVKECCSKQGQLATGFGGGLSEIIIE